MDRNADKINALNSRYGVVPYVGTWIEICTITRSARLHNSRSLRGNVDRNDYYWPVFSNIGGRSLRGNVDRNMDIYIKNHATRPVVPYVGTWIEISLLQEQEKQKKGRSLRGNVDRNSSSRYSANKQFGRSLRGNVDRNAISFRCCFSRCGRSLRGNVDRNVVLKAQLRYDYSRSLRGNVDRNLFRAGFFQSLDGRSLRGNVDRNANYQTIVIKSKESFPTWERG